jgi:hypothetical protein
VGAHFVRREVRQGLLPRILESLLWRRSQAKMQEKKEVDPAHKRMYGSRQLQLKIIANSVYGVLSASGGWFVRMEIGESVTSWGRSMILQAMNIAKASPFNADVIYGGFLWFSNTFSMFLKCKKCRHGFDNDGVPRVQHRARRIFSLGQRVQGGDRFVPKAREHGCGEGVRRASAAGQEALRGFLPHTAQAAKSGLEGRGEEPPGQLAPGAQNDGARVRPLVG